MLGESAAASRGDVPSKAAGMKRKRNLNFGFLPAHPTRADLAKSRRAFKATVSRKAKEMRAEYSRLRKASRSGRTQSTRRLEQLFHEVYGPAQENPRILPMMSESELAAIEKLIRGKAMAQKKKSKKKRTRKGKMPAGLKAYWAKKRRAKNSRSKPAKKYRRRKKRNPRRRTRVRVRTVVKYKYRTRKVKVYPKRRKRRARRANPRRKSVLRIKAPAGLGPKGLRKFRAMAAKAYGVPARIVKR
jgi:hypothetical protein